MSNNNFYEVLDTYADASPEEIRKAYKKKALQTHPDRLPQGATAADKRAAEEKFRKVNNAYEILIDPKNRKLYDIYGVWPPPEDLPEEHRRQRSGNGYRQPFPQNFPSSDPFSHPFFSSSPFGDPFSRPQPPPAFAFRDPFELFNAIFADMHQDFNHAPAGMFRSPMFDPFSLARPSRSLFPSHHSVFPDFFDSFDDHRGNLSRPSNAQSFSFQSSSRAQYSPSSDGQPRWVSESKMVRTVNGETRTVYKKTDSEGNEHVTKIYPDGREKYTVNGVEQSQPSRHIEDAPRSRSSRHQTRDQDYDSEPVIPPEPERGDYKKRWWDRR